MARRVAIYHPDHGDNGAIGWVTEKQYDEVYYARGWQEADPVAAKVSEVLDRPIAKVDDLKIADLRAVGAQFGIAAERGVKKDELLKVVANAVDASLEVTE